MDFYDSLTLTCWNEDSRREEIRKKSFPITDGVGLINVILSLAHIFCFETNRRNGGAEGSATFFFKWNKWQFILIERVK